MSGRIVPSHTNSFSFSGEVEESADKSLEEHKIPLSEQLVQEMIPKGDDDMEFGDAMHINTFSNGYVIESDQPLESSGIKTASFVPMSVATELVKKVTHT